MKEELEENGCILTEPAFDVQKKKVKNGSLPESCFSREINPFVHKLPLDSAYDYFKMLFMSIFVLPIRVFIIILLLIVAYVIATIGMYGLSREELASRPLTGWRRVVKDNVCLWVRFIYVVLGFHFVPEKGRRARAIEAPILVVAPHSSMFDALPLVVMGAPSIVAKGEVQDVPFFAKYIDFTQPVYVWREDTNSRQNTISEIQRRANSEDEWPQVMIFPEGTCTNRTCLITYKPGAFYPGVPVQPVVLRYPNKTDPLTWTWDGPAVAKMLWVTLCQFSNYCEIEYLPVYNPSQEEKDDPRLYAFNVRQVMADCLGIPVMDYTYDDCRVMHQATLRNLPQNTGLVEFQKLRHTYGNLTLKDVEGPLMNQFASMAGTDGKVRLQDFSNYLKLPASEPTVVKLFNLIDKDGFGLFTYRDYLIYRCEMSKDATSEETVAKAFRLFDRKEKGIVHAEAFADALRHSLGLDRAKSSHLFEEVDSEGKGHVTQDDFKRMVSVQPEYGQLFLFYQESIEEGTRSDLVETLLLKKGDDNKAKIE